MHYLFVLVGSFVVFPAQADHRPGPNPEGQTAWLCHSRIGGKIPIVGKLHHTSVLVCPAGVGPVVIGPDGKPRSNPACASFGTQPRNETFLREKKQRVDVRCQSALIPASEVTARITSHSRRWRLWYNCQHAGAEVTGHGCPCCAKETGWFRRLLGWLGFVEVSPSCSWSVGRYNHGELGQ